MRETLSGLETLRKMTVVKQGQDLTRELIRPKILGIGFSPLVQEGLAVALR
jgi:hypothetical protein